ncbi:MAG: hypothetical protein QXG65_03655, partial [Thermoplasmata archaeon]
MAAEAPARKRAPLPPAGTDPASEPPAPAEPVRPASRPRPTPATIPLPFLLDFYPLESPEQTRLAAFFE